MVWSKHRFVLTERTLNFNACNNCKYHTCNIQNEWARSATIFHLFQNGRLWLIVVSLNRDFYYLIHNTFFSLIATSDGDRMVVLYNLRLLVRGLKLRLSFFIDKHHLILLKLCKHVGRGKGDKWNFWELSKNVLFCGKIRNLEYWLVLLQIV